MVKYTFTLLSLAALAVASNAALAAPISIVNPGFDAFVLNPQGFTYETITYNLGDLIPDHSFTFEDINGNGDEISAIGDSATGAPILAPTMNNPQEPATVSIDGYNGPSPGSGILHDTRDYVAGQGPTGPGGFLSFADDLPRAITQTLVGVSFQPNTTYTFTAEVSDRRFGPSDNVSFPSGGATAPQGILLSLAGTTEPAADSFTFTQPAPGETSLATYVFTTGPAGTPGDPTGDITLLLRTQGNNPGPGIAITQAVFDNLTLDATVIPEPSSVVLLGLGGLALAAVGRRAARKC